MAVAEVKAMSALTLNTFSCLIKSRARSREMKFFFVEMCVFVYVRGLKFYSVFAIFSATISLSLRLSQIEKRLSFKRKIIHFSVLIE